MSSTAAASPQQDATPQSKACSNCKKQIELSKLRLHEVQCARNTYRCKECGEVIDKCLQEQHNQEFHEMVSGDSIKECFH